MYKTSIAKFRNLKIIVVIALVVFLSLVLGQKAHATDYIFPVIGDSWFTDDFNASRPSGPHNAIDIFANKRQKVVSRTDGVVTYRPFPEPSWGWMIRIKADNGHNYDYIHLNNDNPGSDDGQGGAFYAYGPDLNPGNRVVKGQLLGYVGDSGNAENTPPHLHFEVVRADGTHINPYVGLRDNSYYIGVSVTTYPRVGDEILPSSPSFMGGYTVAVGHVMGDGENELIAGPGEGGRVVKVLDKTNNTVISSFMPNGPNFLGGVDVAVGDVDDDGVDEIITGAGPGGRYVKIFNADGSLVDQFMPNGPSFLGGIDVAVGDVDGDGIDEIVTGAGSGGRFVKVFNVDGSLIRQFAPSTSLAGLHVATGILDDSGRVSVVATARKGRDPRVYIYSHDGQLQKSYNVYDASFRGGVKVAVANVNPSSPYDEILTISEKGGTARVKITSNTGTFLEWSNYFAEEWWRGYYSLTAGSDGEVYGSMGTNRRSTIRPVSY